MVVGMARIILLLLLMGSYCWADNSVYIDQTVYGTNNTVTITQYNGKNKVGGIGGSGAYIMNGSNNTVTIRQGDPANSTATNTLGLGLYGDNNTVQINQARVLNTGAADGYDSNGHTANIKIVGNSNIFKTQQTNTAVGPHNMLVDLTGNNNTTQFRQLGDNTKQMTVNILGSNETVAVTQGDQGGHLLNLTLNGNGHSVDILQRQSGSHTATVNLTNSGGPSHLTLVQQGSTNQSYSISQQCANLSGCSVSVVQGP